MLKINIPPAQDDADPKASHVQPALEDCRRAERTGRFDQEFRPLPQIEHRPQQLTIVDGPHIRHEFQDHREGESEEEISCQERLRPCLPASALTRSGKASA